MVQRALVMTDIVESTALVCRIGDAAYHDVIDRHDEILVGNLRHLGGELVQGQGDGWLVAFESAMTALGWIRAVQRALVKTLDIQIRAGAHFGPLRIRRTGYLGKSLHLLARLTDLAGPDEALVSQAFAEAAGGVIDGPSRLARLRGVDELIWVHSIHLDGHSTLGRGSGAEQRSSEQVARAEPASA